MNISRVFRRTNKLHLGLIVTAVLLVLALLHVATPSHDDGSAPRPPKPPNAPPQKQTAPQFGRRFTFGNASLFKAEKVAHSPSLVHYDHSVPLIWIGGVPRSGTTLMRALLDAHGDIRCGEETRVLPRILGIHSGMTKSELEMTRLKEAHIDEDVLNEALGAYMLSIISQHGDPAARLCNKDPFTLRSMSRIKNIFPNSKFILMLRDGRATVHSIISRHVTIKNFDIKTYRGALRDWNKAMDGMYSECQRASDACLSVHYEQLVLHPESQMRRILQFLGVAWDANVLRHEQMVGNEISLSKYCIQHFLPQQT